MFIKQNASQYCQVFQHIPAVCSHHVRLLVHLLQLREICLDPCIAGHQVLGGVENLFSFGAGQQQLVGPFPHTHLKVQLLLHVCVLEWTKTQKNVTIPMILL